MQSEPHSLAPLIFAAVTFVFFFLLVATLRRARRRRREELEEREPTRLEEPALRLVPPPETAKPAPEVEEPVAPPIAPKVAAKPLVDERLRAGLARTQEGLFARLGGLFAGKEIPADLMGRVEEVLLTSDVGVRTTQQLVDQLKARLGRSELRDQATLMRALEDDIDAILKQTSHGAFAVPSARPAVILMIGVNGVGKTTTIGKLAARFKEEGHSVLVAAGDTFRAAAADQLKIWSERSGVGYFAGKPQQDPAAVIFEAVTLAKAQGVDIVLCDTAGRLHTKAGLMDELKKVKRVVQKIMPDAPHEVLLVVDGTTGQNAVTQAREFNEALGLTGIVLTKLDGTAKGGVVVAISSELKIPIRFVGVGEGMGDLRPFSPDQFAAALFATG
jgi:fused signal recognition particle receptor